MFKIITKKQFSFINQDQSPVDRFQIARRILMHRAQIDLAQIRQLARNLKKTKTIRTYKRDFFKTLLLNFQLKNHLS